jgi:hypothetical protein
LRGFFFFDLGTAWFQNNGFAHPQLGFEQRVSTNGFMDLGACPENPDLPGTCQNRTFKFWDDENDKLGDGRASYGFGFNVYLGPFQLTWSFAHQMENTVEVCETSIAAPGTPCSTTRIDDPFHEDGTVSQFYIATDF